MAKAREFRSAFGTYTVDSLIGEGGSGRVFAVSDENGGRWALKTLKPESLNSQRLRRFKNEIHFCQKTRHQNVISVYDYGTATDGEVTVPFYVMPLYERTLRSEMPSEDPIEGLKVFAQILDGVEAAHLQGVWHRDLKPDNILVGDTVVVADFGIAHFAEPLLRTIVNTHDKERLANFVYAAPEQRQQQVVDHRADLFSLGLMLNELFTGEIPHGTNYRTIGRAHPSHAFLDDIVERLISQDPGERYQSIEELKREISSRGTKYLAAQELRAAEQQVVAKYTPDEIPELSIIDVDIERGHLTLTLNAEPPADWIQFFRQGLYGHRSLHGHGPGTFEFNRNFAIAQRVDNSNAQGVIDTFKSWIPIVTSMVNEQRTREAQGRERAAQERIQKEIRERRERLETLKKLKF